jgi:cephalosporin hydroxylase
MLDPSIVTRALRKLCPGFYRNLLDQEFMSYTQNYGNLTWLGNPIWQNTMDLWVIQEVLSSIRPGLLIETGTNRGGSSLFFAHLMDLMGCGSIITMDVEKLHDLSHPRISYLIGSSTDAALLSQVKQAAQQTSGPVMLILDSDHSEAHVRQELELLHPLVTVGSYILVQDGITDTLPGAAAWRPGPLPAIESFLKTHPEYEVDDALCKKFPITHHPKGWLKRIR